MGVLENKELFEAVMDLLLIMESELKRERLSLEFCDAWQELEHIVCLLDEESVV